MLVAKKLMLTTELDRVPPPHQREVLVDLRNGANITLVVARTANARGWVRTVIGSLTEADIRKRSVTGVWDADDRIPILAKSIMGVALGVPLEPRRDMHQRCRRNRKVVVEVVEIMF